ncbi:MAG TPA: DUF2058 domain-containing protein [Gammaproteobacteria bacterium]|nr:DUF2058 domain-containing protein [Gammaproteobacteria bacterium]
MSNPFQDQLLKAGLVNKKQVKKANQDKARKQKKLRQSRDTVVDDVKLKVKLAAEDKARRDKALNRQKDEQARNRAISSEINQLITNNCIERNNDCDICYNFEHREKITRIHINAEMKEQIIRGKLGIARIEGRYELVPATIAEKIRQRNEKRIIILDEEKSEMMPGEDDPYADYQVPDDLTW